MLPNVPPVNFTLRTTRDTFANWIEIQTRHVSSEWFPTDNGRCCLQTARWSGIDRLAMETVYLIEEAGATTAEAHFVGPGLEWQVIALAPDRIQIAARCIHPVFARYFLRLVSQIGATWGEASGTIDRYISRLSDGTQSGRPDEPWLAIPEGKKREWVHLWWTGYDKGEIARKFNVTTKTVENALCELRKTYTGQVVPLSADPRRGQKAQSR